MLQKIVQYLTYLNQAYPNNFKSNDLPEIRNCFFGNNQAYKNVILTPLRIIFDVISAGHKVQKGWWDFCIIDNDTCAILTPQGSQIIDAISAFEKDTNIIFVGISGSLGKHKIGDILICNKAIYKGISSYKSLCLDLNYPTCDIYTTSSFAESFEKQEVLSSKYGCVDMETGIVYGVCKRQRKRAISIQIISDNFLNNKFYNTDITVLIPKIKSCIANTIKSLERVSK